MYIIVVYHDNIRLLATVLRLLVARISYGWDIHEFIDVKAMNSLRTI